MAAKTKPEPMTLGNMRELGGQPVAEGWVSQVAFRLWREFRRPSLRPQIGDCQKIRHDQRAQFQRVP